MENDDGDRGEKSIPGFITKLLAMINDTSIKSLISWTEVMFELVRSERGSYHILERGYVQGPQFNVVGARRAAKILQTQQFHQSCPSTQHV